jgi:hypothetical protein
LHLLLYVLAGEEIHDWPDFVPRIEVFASALKNSPLPLESQVLLMQHYERAGEFGKAEDALFSMLDRHAENERLLRFGIAFYERILSQPDAGLETGNLPRHEAEASLAELRQRIDFLNAAGSTS